MMDVLQAFQIAAKHIQADPRYIAFQEIREKNDQDESLNALTEEFAQAKEELSKELEKDIAERNNDLIVELNAKTNRLYGEILSHEGIVAYNKAKVELDQLVAQIDAIITGTLEGADPMKMEIAVSQKPSSCSPQACATCASACH